MSNPSHGQDGLPAGEIHGSVLGLIGNTPMVRLGRLQGADRADILA